MLTHSDGSNSGTTVYVTMTDTDKKRRYGPLPTGKGLQVQVRLQPDMVAMVDAWIAAQAKSVSRPEAIRLMLKELMDKPTKL